jgi:hypothetical protein
MAGSRNLASTSMLGRSRQRQTLPQIALTTSRRQPLPEPTPAEKLAAATGV